MVSLDLEPKSKNYLSYSNSLFPTPNVYFSDHGGTRTATFANNLCCVRSENQNMDISFGGLHNPHTCMHGVKAKKIRKRIKQKQKKISLGRMAYTFFCDYFLCILYMFCILCIDLVFNLFLIWFSWILFWFLNKVEKTLFYFKQVHISNYIQTFSMNNWC